MSWWIQKFGTKRYGQFTRLFYHSAKSNLGMRHVGSHYLTDFVNCVRHTCMFRTVYIIHWSNKKEGSPENFGTRPNEVSLSTFSIKFPSNLLTTPITEQNNVLTSSPCSFLTTCWAVSTSVADTARHNTYSGKGGTLNWRCSIVCHPNWELLTYYN